MRGSETAAWWRPVECARRRRYVSWMAADPYKHPRWEPPLDMRARSWRNVTIVPRRARPVVISVEGLRGDDMHTAERAIAKWRAEDPRRGEVEVEVGSIRVSEKQPRPVDPPPVVDDETPSVNASTPKRAVPAGPRLHNDDEHTVSSRTTADRPMEPSKSTQKNKRRKRKKDIVTDQATLLAAQETGGLAPDGRVVMSMEQVQSIVDTVVRSKARTTRSRPSGTLSSCPEGTNFAGPTPRVERLRALTPAQQKTAKNGVTTRSLPKSGNADPLPRRRRLLRLVRGVRRPHAPWTTRRSVD